METCEECEAAAVVREWLRWLRLERGFSRVAIAAIVEVDSVMLRRIEFGYSPVPPEVRQRIAEMAHRWGYV